MGEGGGVLNLFFSSFLVFLGAFLGGGGLILYFLYLFVSFFWGGGGREGGGVERKEGRGLFSACFHYM